MPYLGYGNLHYCKTKNRFLKLRNQDQVVKWRPKSLQVFLIDNMLLLGNKRVDRHVILDGVFRWMLQHPVGQRVKIVGMMCNKQVSELRVRGQLLVYYVANCFERSSYIRNARLERLL